MPVHEKQAQLANTFPKRGLGGRSAGPVNAAGSAPDEPYALGNVHAGGPATGAADRITGRPAGLVVSSPSAGVIRVTFTAETGADAPANYKVYRGSTVIDADRPTGAQEDYTGQPAGTHTVTIRGVDEDGIEFTESAGVQVVVA